MLRKATFFGTLIGIGFLFGAISGAISAEMPNDYNMQTAPSKIAQFKSINQPLANKVLVTVGGIGLIGAELWWFLMGKTRSVYASPR